MFRHILECREETREVLVVVKLLHFGQRGPFHPMTMTQFQQRRRFDRPFEMQMQFSLRQREDEAGWLRRHTTILKDRAI